MVAHQQYTSEFNKLLETFNAWINFTQASFEYLLLLLDVWLKAFEELMGELISSQQKGETVENVRQFLQVWSSIFDRVFAQRFHSEDALEIHGKFMNAAMAWRLHQQQLMQVFLKMNDLPTRSELDEIYRSLYELRKEVKNLKKTLAESLSNEVL
ncbi:poly(R)-hydroxyalkanoic acid synthase subunit PhaE [Mastigocladopsis repens]|uniref:poly(R)-hydroxyalkanoic acid synthase subunit PhaE n=1 Tax=Mastigocladopsis repens TaxID=221287 RepID=UPI0002EF635C|nr:poly(R)-hydroxyalkanoic acid synthase subunit PhaE [Mastigocladopsis repens]